MQPAQRLVHVGKDKGIVPEIKRRIAAVDRPMMVWADKHEIR
jgi:hypothetical protein